jgi:hypothetical protein
MYTSSLPDTGPFFIQPDNNICSIEKLYKIHNGNRDVVIRHLNMNQLWKRVGLPPPPRAKTKTKGFLKVSKFS